MLRDSERDKTPDAAASAIWFRDMLKVKSSHIKYFFETPLYFSTDGFSFESYKPPNVWIKDSRLRQERYPKNLYIHAGDKHTALRELQKGLNVQLEEDIRSNDPVNVKNTLINLVHETIMDPTSEGIDGAATTVDVLFSEYLRNQSVINNLVNVISADYSTAIHSVNVMALTFRFCFFCSMSEEETKKLGLCALLHDVGKIKISKRILKSDRRLTENEYELIKQHTVFGYNILKGCAVPEDICLAARNHHERADGSGYPLGVSDLTQEAEIIGFIDCYEALTANERPYRNAVSPYSALSHIKTELFKGHFHSKVYESFVKSLGQHQG